MSLQYGPPALLTGPCLESTCGQFLSSSPPEQASSVTNLNCRINLVLCVANSTSYTNPLDPTNPLGLDGLSSQTNCSYALISPESEDEILGSCTLRELSGDLAGRDNVWSLFDGGSTIVVTATAIAAVETTVKSMLYVGTTIPEAFKHFIDPVATLDSGTASQSPPVTSTLSSLATTSGLDRGDAIIPASSSSIEPSETMPSETIPMVLSSATSAPAPLAGSTINGVDGSRTIRGGDGCSSTTATSTPTKGTGHRLSWEMRRSWCVLGLLLCIMLHL